MRRAFTLVELLISISILSLLMLFLYKSYSNLNRANKIYKEKREQLSQDEMVKKVLYLDFLMAKKESFLLDNRDRRFDFISFETKNSIHRRINPFVSYIVKEGVLYRLESLQQIESDEVGREIAFDIDKIGSVTKVKFFEKKDKKSGAFLVDLRFSKDKRVLLKIKVLN